MEVFADDSIAMEPKTVLLVSADRANRVIQRLKRMNCVVIQVKDGESALAFAKHSTVDAFVLMSTGRVMGRTETALNLRDIRPGGEIIFVAHHNDKPTAGEIAARAIPRTRVMTLQELADYLADH